MKTVTWTATVEIEVVVDDTTDLAALYDEVARKGYEHAEINVSGYGFGGKIVGLRRDDLMGRAGIEIKETPIAKGKKDVER